METKRVCKECEKVIDLKSDKHVLLGTYSGEKIDDESYFHFTCFVKWYNQKVSEKAKNSVSTMQSKVQNLMKDPKIAGLMSMIGGTDKLKGMLNTDLSAGSSGLDIEGMMAELMPKEKPKKNDDDGKRKTKPRAKPKKKKVQ